MQNMHDQPSTPTPSVQLRDPQPGDMGWVVQQHGEVYWREYGWDIRFEALVAGIVSSYIDNYQSDFERCWIAEVNGVRAGSAFVVRKSKTTAQLRMLTLISELSFSQNTWLIGRRQRNVSYLFCLTRYE